MIEKFEHLLKLLLKM